MTMARVNIIRLVMKRSMLVGGGYCWVVVYMQGIEWIVWIVDGIFADGIFVDSTLMY